MFKLLALMGMFCNSVNDFVFRLVGSVEDPRTYRNLFYTLQSAVILILCVIYMALFKVPLETSGTAILYGAILGVLSYVTYLLLIISLETGDVSRNISIYRMNFIIVSILAVIILQEKLSVNKVLGVVLLILAILIFSGGGKQPGAVRNKGLQFSIAACFMAGILNIVTKIVLNTGTGTFSLIFYRFCVVFIIALGTVIYKKVPVIPPKKLGLMSGISGVLLFLAISLMYVAMGSEEVLVIMPLSQMSFVITAILSFVFLKEPLSIRKVTGIGLAVLCVLLIY